MTGSDNKKYTSITKRTVVNTVISLVVLSLIIQVVSLSVYGLALTDHYIQLASDMARQASVSAAQGADSVGLTDKVMERYRSLTDEQREQNGSEEYRQYFKDIDTGKGSDYDVIQHMLGAFLKYSNVYDVYLAMYDEKTCKIVYVVDPDPVYPMQPGEWENVERKGMEKFLNWKGSGDLYDIDNTEKYGWMCTAGVPLKNAEGETRAFVLVDITIDTIRDGLVDFALKLSIISVLATMVIAAVVSLRMKRTVVDPINLITNAAKKYAEDKRAGVEKTQHFSQLDIQTRDEIEKLSQVMQNMELDLQDYEQRIAAIAAERERIGVELKTATLIQQSMLPHVFPPFPDRSEFDIYASMSPAKEVGGDFYDFFLIDEDHLGLVMADVSGKGVPAALFMMVSKTILQSCAMLGKSAGETLTKTNEAICSNNQAEMFVTVWFGILEISTGRITAANAGHEFPAIKKADGSFELLKDKHGLVIGAMDGITYMEYEIQLSEGDQLFLYTDGVAEATRSDNELFGTQRMLEALNRDPKASPETAAKNVAQAVGAFVGEAEQFDDMTMLCIEYKNKKKKD